MHRLFFGTSCRPFPKPIYSRSSQSLRSLPARPWRLGSHPHYLAITPSLSLPLLSSDLPILVLPFEVWSGLLFLACANGFLSLPQLLTLLGAAVLAIYDLRFMEYPLVIWCCLHALVLFLSGSNLLMLVFLLLAIGAHFFFIGMGAGDFLLLATFSLSFSSTKILILIQIASILGILVFALKKKETGFPLFPVSFSVIMLYCFIRYFADKFFLFCSLRF